MSDFWTAERVAWLIQSKANGAGDSALARIAGVTPSTIIGKVHRLQAAGLMPKGPGHGVARLTPRPVPPAAMRPVKPPRPRAGEPIFDPAFARTILNIGSGDCHFPVGDPLDEAFRYCGRPKFEGSPYCEGHAAMCYQPKTVRPGRYHQRY